MYVIEIRNGELCDGLREQMRAFGVRNAAIVSLIGAVDGFSVSTMPEADATKDVVTTYVVPAELHGGGEVVDGEPHIHATLAVEGDRAVAGHVHEAKVGTHFVRAYVLRIPE